MLHVSELMNKSIYGINIGHTVPIYVQIIYEIQRKNQIDVYTMISCPSYEDFVAVGRKKENGKLEIDLKKTF